MSGGVVGTGQSYRDDALQEMQQVSQLQTERKRTSEHLEAQQKGQTMQAVGTAVGIAAMIAIAAWSSARFKKAISLLRGDALAKLAKLRPVSFIYKSDATNTTRYGLIAEEVAKVMPELVLRNEAGEIQGVNYGDLIALLLRQNQDQQSQINRLHERLVDIDEAIKTAEAQ